MKQQMVKRWLCQFLLIALGFVLLGLASAAAQGTLSVPAGLGLALAALLGMNVLCGALAPAAPQKAAAPRPGCSQGAASPARWKATSSTPQAANSASTIPLSA